VKPVFQVGQFWVWVLLAMGVALAVFYLYCYRQEARHARRLKPGQKKLLRTLRILVGILAVLALGQPGMNWVSSEERLPVLPIVLDESTSMDYQDCRDNPLVQKAPRDLRRRYDTAKTVVQKLQEKLTRTHRVKLFTFSDTSKLLKEIPHRESDGDPVLTPGQVFERAPDPTGEYTNVGDALTDAMRELAGEQL